LAGFFISAATKGRHMSTKDLAAEQAASNEVDQAAIAADDDFDALYDQMKGNDAPAPAVEPEQEIVEQSAQAEEVEAAPAATPEAQQEAADPFASLPEDVRKQVEELRTQNAYLNQHRMSQAGREQAHQRRIRELEDEAKNKATAKQPADIDASLQALAAQLEDYAPGTGEALLASLRPVVAEVATLRNQSAQVMQVSQAAAEEAAAFAAKQVVSQKFPTWEQDIRTDAFWTWHAAQPKQVQALAASTDPEDAAWMMGRYYADRQVVTDVRASRQADKQQQLKNAAGVTARAAGDPAALTDDDAEFQNIYQSLKPRRTR
jgi:hypothetical protein